ncbi:MAG: hypothetical protein MJZ05_10840 [Fibrobacter sp.]|nr:hypothetical protein [Fibrobacter sp.]
MTEILILAIFCVTLLTSLVAGVPLLYALLFGLILFAGYGVRCAGLRETAKMCWNGVKTARGVLLLFVLLGLLTSLWRASGTIPTIVSYAVELIHPTSFILLTFLLNSAMSLLTGTALGTAGTMGVICATVGRTLGVDDAWMGGAILAGVYFGNRISPISSMALLAANVTKTDIYQNVRGMLKTTWLPFLLSCGIYFWAGLDGDSYCGEISIYDRVEIYIEAFAQEFSLSHWALIPAVVIIVLSVLRVRTSLVLLWSSLSAFVLALVIENKGVMELLQSLVFGYKTSIPYLEGIINGGGLVSMVNVFAIVVIAGCFGGIFKGTQMLLPLQSLVAKLSKRTNPFVATLAAAVVTSCVVCNQTLTIILTNQMTENLNGSDDVGKNLQALNIYDTAVTVIALVPWSVATAIVLNASQAPNKAVLCACFLYLLPLCRIIFKKKKT